MSDTPETTIATDDRTNLRRLAEAATPGPWQANPYVDERGYHLMGVESQPGAEDVAGVYGRPEEQNVAADAAYIAAANPQAVLDLLNELDRLRQGGCARDQRTTQFCAEVVDARCAERAKIVTWLRERASEMMKLNQHDDVRLRGAAYLNTADAIERGVHTLPTDRSPK